METLRSEKRSRSDICTEEQEMDPSQRVIDYVKDIAEYITTREGKISASALLESFFVYS